MFSNGIYSCDGELNFQHHYSLRCHMIHQKSFYYADLMLKKHLLLLSMLKTVALLNFFVKTDSLLLKVIVRFKENN